MKQGLLAFLRITLMLVVVLSPALVLEWWAWQPSDMDLATVYANDNSAYFNGELPRCSVRWSNIIGHLDLIGISFTHPCIIEVTTQLKGMDTYVELALLHEMAHVHVSGKCPRVENAVHGRCFQAEMMRLAKLGALKELW